MSIFDGVEDLLAILKKAFLVLGIMSAAIFVCTPVGAGQEGTGFALKWSGFPVRSGPSDNHSGNGSSDMGFVISLTPSLSLDLKLSSVETGQAPAGETQSSVPPIPIPKAPGSELRYGRLGVGLSFRF